MEQNDQFFSQYSSQFFLSPEFSNRLEGIYPSLGDWNPCLAYIIWDQLL